MRAFVAPKRGVRLRTALNDIVPSKLLRLAVAFHDRVVWRQHFRGAGVQAAALRDLSERGSLHDHQRSGDARHHLRARAFAVAHTVARLTPKSNASAPVIALLQNERLLGVGELRSLHRSALLPAGDSAREPLTKTVRFSGTRALAPTRPLDRRRHKPFGFAADLTDYLPSSILLQAAPLHPFQETISNAKALAHR